MSATIGIYAQWYELRNPLLWIKASTLTADHAVGSAVTTWPAFKTGLPSAVSSVFGTAEMPLYQVGPFPYVKYNEVASSTNCCFSNFGALNIPMENGLTGYAVCRFRTPSPWARLFDFQGPKIGVDDLLCTLNGDSMLFLDRNRASMTTLFTPYENKWIVIFFQLSRKNSSMYLNINGNETTGTWTPRTTPYSYTVTRLVLSNFPSDPAGRVDLAEFGMFLCDIPLHRIRKLVREISQTYGIV